MQKNTTKKNSSRKISKLVCDKNMKFEDCELAILRHAVDEGEIVQKKKEKTEDLDSTFKILEEFIVRKKLILYGGLALNRLMPKESQFYNESIDIPDYDMFSENALDDAKELADLYNIAGYTNVEARSGVHYGTFKVFVNFIGVADITQIPQVLFDKLKKDAVIISGMYYSPPDYLRMALYLELSRPAGDISRWEKVLKRLTLLNKYYPLKTPFNCEKVDFQRKMETITDIEENEKIYFITRDYFIDHGVIFFGGYASTLYSRYMPKRERKLLQNIPDFDVLSIYPDECAKNLVDKLKEEGYKNAKLIVNEAIGELIPRHIQINIGKDTIAFIFEPIACHSYNTLKINEKEINIATIDTMLSFYLAFIYIDKFKYIKDRILCMAKFLFEVQQRNRLKQDGLLKRFSINCYGKQLSMKSIRAEKAEKYEELKDKRGTREYDMWFLKYAPQTNKENNNENKKNKDEKKSSFIPAFIESKNTQKRYNQIKKRKPQKKNTRKNKIIKNEKDVNAVIQPRFSVFYK